MSIKEQVEDAIFLAENSRYLGALAMVMLAVAASSRKEFPKGKVRSIKTPIEMMGDCEAFTEFLGARIRKILFGDYCGPDVGRSSISIEFKGKQLDVAYILYKYYRCGLIHEGELPEDIEFNPASHNKNLGSENGGVSISSGKTLRLDYGWIDVLTQAVTHARCNSALFGIDHFDLVPVSGIDENDHCNFIVNTFGITPGRYRILKEVVRHITPTNVLNDSDSVLVGKFSALVGKGVIKGGAVTGLSSHQLSDRSGTLLPKGLEILKEIGKAFQIVKV